MTIQITSIDQKTYQAIIDLLPQLDDSVALPSEDYLKNMLASGKFSFVRCSIGG